MFLTYFYFHFNTLQLGGKLNHAMHTARIRLIMRYFLCVHTYKNKLINGV